MLWNIWWKRFPSNTIYHICYESSVEPVGPIFLVAVSNPRIISLVILLFLAFWISPFPSPPLNGRAKIFKGSLNILPNCCPETLVSLPQPHQALVTRSCHHLCRPLSRISMSGPCPPLCVLHAQLIWLDGFWTHLVSHVGASWPSSLEYLLVSHLSACWLRICSQAVASGRPSIVCLFIPVRPGHAGMEEALVTTVL